MVSVKMYELDTKKSTIRTIFEFGRKHTFCGLINARSNRYDAAQDFSSAEYKFTRDTLTTMLGQHKLTEDKE